MGNRLDMAYVNVDDGALSHSRCLVSLADADDSYCDDAADEGRDHNPFVYVYLRQHA